MNPGTLAERPSLAARHALEQRALLAYRLRVSCWLALALIPVFGGLDVILHPQLLPLFVRIRLAMMALAGASLLALRTPLGERWVGVLGFLMFWVTGFGIIVMVAFIGGGSSPYYAGVSLVMLAAAVLMPWDMATSIALTATLIVTYAATCVAVAGVPDLRLFVSNLFFLCSTAVITIVSHQAGARARRREFLQRVALEEAGRHRDEFLANITHELRTPLAAILGFAEMLDEYMDERAEVEHGWLRRIRENAATLYRLIVQLLDFSRIEAGALQLERERIDLAGVVSQVAANIQAIAGEDGPEVRIEIAPETPDVVGDRARVEEIVTNLASNALKFSEGRPVTLSVGRGTVQREPAWQRIVPDPGTDAEPGPWAEIAVTDAGQGIATEDLRRLFVAFQQLDGSSTRRQGGTGLGLAISARLAAAMRGHIAVRSVPAQGSTFALLLPVTLGADDEVSAATEAGDAASPAVESLG